MPTDTTSPARALDLLIRDAENVRVLAIDQRQIADMQHATAHKLENLSTKLKKEATLLQDELTKV
jgi:hypothetical protein